MFFISFKLTFAWCSFPVTFMSCILLFWNFLWIFTLQVFCICWTLYPFFPITLPMRSDGIDIFFVSFIVSCVLLLLLDGSLFGQFWVIFSVAFVGMFLWFNVFVLGAAWNIVFAFEFCLIISFVLWFWLFSINFLLSSILLFSMLMVFYFCLRVSSSCLMFASFDEQLSWDSKYFRSNCWCFGLFVKILSASF